MAATLGSTVAFVASAQQATPPGSIKTIDGSNLAMQKVPTIFKFQAHLSQAKMPVGDAKLDVWVNLMSADKTLCTQSIPGVRVRDSILNLEVGRDTSCPLDDYIATHNDLKLQVCIKSQNNCLKPIELSSVPYAFKATYAQTAQRAQVTDRATLADYAQRVGADKDVLTPGVLGHGYFDFQTPPDVSNLFGTEQAPQGIDRLNSGYMLWTPVNPAATSLSIGLKAIDTDQPGPLQELLFHAATTTARGNFRANGWGVVGGGDPDGTAKFTVNGGDAVVHGNGTIAGNFLAGGWGVIGGGAVDGSAKLTVNGSESVLGNATIKGNESVTGTATIGADEIVMGNVNVNLSERINGTLSVGSSATIGTNLTCGGAASVAGQLTTGSFVDNGTAQFSGPAQFANTTQFIGNSAFGASGSSATLDVWDSVTFHGPVSGLPATDPSSLNDESVKGTAIKKGTMPLDRLSPDVAAALQTMITSAVNSRVTELETKNDMLWAAATLSDTIATGIPWGVGMPSDTTGGKNYVSLSVKTGGGIQATDEIGNVSQPCLCRKRNTFTLSSQPAQAAFCHQVCGPDGAVPATPNWTVPSESTPVKNLVATAPNGVWIWLSKQPAGGALHPTKPWQQTYSMALGFRP